MQEGANDPRLKGAVSAAHAENLYLDPIVDRGRPLVTSATVVEGVPAAERITVKQWKEFQQKSGAAEVLPRAGEHKRSHDWKLLERFEVSRHDMRGNDISDPNLTKVADLIARFLLI
jgi:hypothetical protein